ncbi:MAG: hypothetical protein V4505_09960 [Pseudomonadota bacterium]
MPLPPPAPEFTALAKPAPYRAHVPSAKPMGSHQVNTDVFEFFTRFIPKQQNESLKQFKDRVMRDPVLSLKVEEALRNAPMAEQIKLAAMRRALAVAGGQRTGGSPVATPVAGSYTADFRGSPEARKKFAADIVNFLDTGFDYSSPTNGSIFWTGVDPDKLVKQVGVWNEAFGAQMFGQLEATTDARYINGAFDWSVKDAEQQVTQDYFGKVSERYGANAVGHVTSVQMWGLRNDSIFTTKELPTLFQHMADAISKGETPAVQDLTIVVLDPLEFEQMPYKFYTNAAIGGIAIVHKSVDDSVSKWIRGRQDCGVTKYLRDIIPPALEGYWLLQRGAQEPSAAALQIGKDYPLIKRG